jgi:hypothetical protein
VEVAKTLNVPEDVIAKTVEHFKGLSHRLEFVGSFNEIKFDVNSTNIHSFCDYLTKKEGLGINHCPYKKALDKSACSLTNSIQADSTKSKEVSNTINSLSRLT